MNQYQVSFGEAIKRAFSNYCCFTGRASRSEYWWFQLFTYLVGMVFYIPCIGFLFSNSSEVEAGVVICLILVCLFGLACVLPSMGLLWRRLHDTGRSGWNVLWSLIPYAGAIVLIVFCCLPSEPNENKYGPVPNVEG